MLVLKCFRPDKMLASIQTFITGSLTSKFIEPPAFHLASSFKDSANDTPIVFILSPGADPIEDLWRFAEEMRFAKKLDSISLGQGQGARAEILIRDAMERGTWVLLQNCHLCVSWMPSLEKIVESIEPEKVHRDFRLWLTSMPCEQFPVSVLQNSVKMTNEPPRGIKTNMLRTYGMFDEGLIATGVSSLGGGSGNSGTSTLNNSSLSGGSSSNQGAPNSSSLHASTNTISKKSRAGAVWRKLLFGLCFFHAVIQERRKFGPLGWNISYEYTSGDLSICVRQLKMLLDEYEEVPYKVLQFLAGHINYGGRVTDEWDRRTLMNLLDTYYSPPILEDNYKLSSSGVYYVPTVDTLKGFLAYLRSLPVNDEPEVFGLHENANISFLQSEASTLFDTILSLQPKSTQASSGGRSRDEVIGTLAQSILQRIPAKLSFNSNNPRLVRDPKESMNTVLSQEIIRYNRLLKEINTTLQELMKALKGLMVMSLDLENMANSLYDNQVPTAWQRRSYPSLMNLNHWVIDLENRLRFIQNWAENGKPNVFWFSGFFFPQAFLTAQLQNYARKYVVSVDTVSFEFKIMNESEEQLTSPPSDGCYIKGLFLEGASWDSKQNVLSECLPRKLYTELPVLWLIPVVKPANEKETKITSGQNVYHCPVYKTLRRAGTLSTTGHSTNYVVTVELPSIQTESHWVKRSVDLICRLNYV
eukprot:TRINITY_DN8841_c0_g1_i2.p1 TRINITY_DN8841_c0_g1~~TRINITY_DN8841_c0_g1_i2.p1  ORF type:complete len:786 (-),score=133.90 TRINITY_DN8841_c0_g1_i2:9-2105(-)